MGDFARLQTSSVNRERLKAVTLNQIERAAKEMPGEKMTPEELVKFIKERVYGL
jgi:hypothetical protein